MSLETISKAFAYSHGISFHGQRHGFMGGNDRLVVGYRDNGIKQNLFVKKSFPPIENTYESKILISDRVQKQILRMKILNGCLQDYITQLDGVKNKFCNLVQEMLVDSYFLGNQQKPPTSILQYELPIDIPGHEPDLWVLLKSLFPSSSSK